MRSNLAYNFAKICSDSSAMSTNKQDRIMFACWCFFFRQKIDEQKAEIERLEQILDGKVEAEKKNIGNSHLSCLEPKTACKN